MPDDAVLNWDTLVYKNDTTSDGQDAGNIVHIAGDNLRIMQGLSRQSRREKSQFLSTTLG